METSSIKPDTSVQTVPHLVYLSLGSNVGDREAQLRDALIRLNATGRVVAVSSFYETEPVELTHQPWFLNCTAALETTLTAPQLMTAILRIEEEMGRRRVQKKGPRSIDIDILMFDDQVSWIRKNSRSLIPPCTSAALCSSLWRKSRSTPCTQS